VLTIALRVLLPGAFCRVDKGEKSIHEGIHARMIALSATSCNPDRHWLPPAETITACWAKQPSMQSIPVQHAARAAWLGCVPMFRGPQLPCVHVTLRD